MKTLFLLTILATSLLVRAEPPDNATFQVQHPNLRKLDAAAIKDMRHAVPFADAVYEDTNGDKGIKRWYVVVEDKIIAHYIEIFTFLSQDQANRVVESDLSTQGYKLISNGGGFLTDRDKVSGNNKYFYFYSVADLYYRAQADYERKGRAIEEAEMNRIRRLLKAQQAGTEQPATRPESKSGDIEKPQPDTEGRSR